ncbi:hypothetical protein [Microbispora hainanensis]|uniref:hypothetical protein n=1 Tax=Microbispora hainanensis TaxID=568844 RepID=UPI00142EF5D5|nr:hypothetical protein [Microbispora hainanensis]
MGTATPVPETRSRSDHDLPADGAHAAIRRCGGRHGGESAGSGPAPASARERRPAGSGR